MMSENAIKWLLINHYYYLHPSKTWEGFCKFMNGQTYTSTEDGTALYYLSDVIRYLNGLPVID